MAIAVIAALLTIGALSCSSSGGSSSSSTEPGVVTTPSADDGVPTLYDAACAGTLASGPGIALPSELDEISGLAASTTHEGVLWAIADGGSEASLYAVDLDGTVLATVELDGATNVDWEDVAIGPGPPGTEGSYLYVADIGDNTSVRDSVALYVLPEPEVADGSATPDKITAAYSTGPTDAEALAVTTEGVWVLGKVWSGGAAPLYLLDAASGRFEPTGAELDLSVDLVTAMDAQPAEGVLAVRSYGALNLFDLSGPDVAAALETKPCKTPTINEGQGESVAVLPGGTGLVTAAESGTTRPAELHVVRPT